MYRSALYSLFDIKMCSILWHNTSDICGIGLSMASPEVLDGIFNSSTAKCLKANFRSDLKKQNRKNVKAILLGNAVTMHCLNTRVTAIWTVRSNGLYVVK